ncbi:MAG: exonuclease domain-containing protein [Eubacterium sp.]|nr:exonuclease domain-containing protein [Eubacterium sp.]
MNYIIFDLEWNQCPYGKSRENKKLPFEIIEIGAVKLNQDFAVADSLHLLIRPRVYRSLHFRTRQVVQMREADLYNRGVPFPEAAKRFLAWAGGDSIFCTWGSSDLTELQRNLKFYGLLQLLPGPLQYYDVQYLYSLTDESGHERRSLESAIDRLGIEKGREFHSALSDAWYTTAVMQRLNPETIREHVSIDAYQNPKTKTDEIYMVYPEYSLFISREFANKEEMMRDSEVRAVHCCFCGRRAHRKIQWFSAAQRRSECLAVCQVHGSLACEVRIRHSDSGGVFAEKTIRAAAPHLEEELQERKRVLREKRRKKRQN